MDAQGLLREKVTDQDAKKRGGCGEKLTSKVGAAAVTTKVSADPKNPRMRMTLQSCHRLK